MMKFEMVFRIPGTVDGVHTEIVSGEYQYVFAWLQGYLKASNYLLQTIKVLEVLE